MPFMIDVPFPERFVRFNSIQPDPWLGLDGLWYFVVYGHPDGATESQQYVFRWRPGITAEIVGLQDETNARGSLAVHDKGGQMWSWQGSGSFPRLVVQSVPDFVPAPLDARVDALLARVAELEARESAAGLTPKQLEAVTRLCAFLGL